MSLELVVAVIAGIVLPIVIWLFPRSRSRSAEFATQAEVPETSAPSVPPTSQPSSDVSIHSDLIFESVDAFSSVKYKAYMPKWHEGPGSYSRGYDFLWLEYECARDNPFRVDLQVESATAANQPDWNLRKRQLAARVEEVVAAELPGLVWPTKRGRQLSQAAMERNKSTTVYSFFMPDNAGRNPMEKATLAINQLHARLGGPLDNVWNEQRHPWNTPVDSQR